MTPFVRLDAIALPIAQPNFDTDQIIPARFLSRARELGLAECLFRDIRFAADGSERPEFPLNNDAFRPARIVVWALHDYGFRAAIAPSFGDIFRNNCIKNGMLPIALPADVVSDLLVQLQTSPGAEVQIDLPTQTVTLPNGSEHAFDIDPFAKHCLLNGVDEMAFTLSQVDDILAFENRYGRENF